MTHWHELAGAAGQVDSTGPVVDPLEFTVAPPVETAVLGVRKLMVAGVPVSGLHPKMWSTKYTKIGFGFEPNLKFQPCCDCWRLSHSHALFFCFLLQSETRNQEDKTAFLFRGLTFEGCVWRRGS